MGMHHSVRADDADGAAKGASQSSTVTLFLDQVRSVADEDGEAAKKLLSQPETAALLAREIRKKIYEFMLEPVKDGEAIDTSSTLSQIGLDSLMSIELRKWLRRVVGIVISVLEIMGSGSLIHTAGQVDDGQAR
ncbi:hypothetical protein F4804DRAFT_318771 [Jackrogersella minutella]|nr:hypothetical protein F4804DRAFT_318771 [Jackrogersella minutella]